MPRIIELNKKKWEKLKEQHNVKSKGMIAAVLTSKSGINVGKKINDFQSAVKAMEHDPKRATILKAGVAVKALVKALRDYAAEKEFTTQEARNFRGIVIQLADEAESYEKQIARFLRAHEKEFPDSNSASMVGALKDASLL